jgi:hypothetical protein
MEQKDVEKTDERRGPSAEALYRVAAAVFSDVRKAAACDIVLALMVVQNYDFPQFGVAHYAFATRMMRAHQEGAKKLLAKYSARDGVISACLRACEQLSIFGIWEEVHNFRGAVRAHRRNGSLVFDANYTEMEIAFDDLVTSSAAEHYVPQLAIDITREELGKVADMAIDTVLSCLMPRTEHSAPSIRVPMSHSMWNSVMRERIPLLTTYSDRPGDRPIRPSAPAQDST